MELLLGFGCLGLLAAVSAFLSRFWKFSQLPDTLPWAGVRKEAFSGTRASFRQLTGSLQTLAEGYTKVRCPHDRSGPQAISCNVQTV